MVTNKEIAKRTGVSVATVSRVFNNLGGVSDSTRKRVIEVAESLGRFPKKNNLKRQVLVVSTPSANDLISELIEHSACFNLSILCKLLNNYESKFDESELNDDFDGVIVADYVLSDQSLNNLTNRIPVVQCRNFRVSDKSVSVAVDDLQLGYDLTRHLIETGKKRIAYVDTGNYGFCRHSIQRFRGHRLALLEAGLEYNSKLSYQFNANTTFSDLIAESNQSPLAVIFDSESTTMSFLSYINGGKVNIPHDLAIATYDDSTNMRDFRITTAQQSLSDMAKSALYLLSEIINGKLKMDNSYIAYVGHSLNIRESTIGETSDES